MTGKAPLGRGPLVFRLGAVTNWLVTAPAVVAPEWVGSQAGAWFGFEPPNHPFLVRIWAGMAFMFGCMFWSIAGDMLGRIRLIPYAWIEKSVTAVSVSLAFASGAAPGALFWLIVVTDWIWIPLFFHYGCVASRVAASLQSSSYTT
jgi:hypothetical protein